MRPPQRVAQVPERREHNAVMRPSSTIVDHGWLFKSGFEIPVVVESRGRCKPSATRQDIVGIACIWGLRIAKRSSMLCAIVAVAHPARKHLAPDVGQRDRLHFGFGARVTQRLRLKTCALIAAFMDKELTRLHLRPTRRA